MQVEEAVVGGRGVDLEVARMNNDADRGVNSERDAVDETVRDADRINGEWSDGEALSGFNLDQFGIVEQAVFFQLVLDVGERKLSAIDRDVEVGENGRQRADVVFVAVRENDAANVVAVLEQVADVGNDDVDAEQFSLGKHEASVDDNDVVAP